MFNLMFYLVLLTEPLTVSTGPFTRDLVLTGEIGASVAVNVTAPKTETWQVQIKWLVEEGSIVKPNDVVARFDNSGIAEQIERLSEEIDTKTSDLQTKMAEAENALDEQRLQVHTKEIEYAKAKLDAGIPKELVSLREHQEFQLVLLKAEKDLDIARKTLATQEQNTSDDQALAKVDLEYRESERTRLQNNITAMEVRTPTGGVVIYSIGYEGRKSQTGDTVQATAPIMTIPDLSSLEVEAWASETDYGLLEPGQKTQIWLDAYPDEAFSGRVTSVSRKGDTRNHWGKAAWFKVRIALDQLDQVRMRPGMSVRAEVRVTDAPNVLRIPAGAVRQNKDGCYVETLAGEQIPFKPANANPFFFLPEPGSALKEGMELRP